MKILSNYIVFFLFILILSNNFIYTEKTKIYEFNPQKELLDNNRIRKYFLNDLENLKSPLPPKYIHLIDWRDYAHSKQFIKRGILFTYRNLSAKNIYVAGNFTNWNLIPMNRNPYGVFYYVYPIDLKKYNQKNIYYKFFVDGIWVLDPLNNSKEIINDDILSVFFINEDRYKYLDKTEILEKKKISDNQFIYLVEFKISEKLLKQKLRKDKIYKVYVVGNFNYWDQEANELMKDEEGIYKTQLYLPSGTYFYNFIVDGEWILDPLNENTKYLTNFQKILNYLDLP